MAIEALYRTIRSAARQLALRDSLAVIWAYKGGARIALGFTPHSGQPKTGLIETLMAAGFTNPQVVEGDKGFCAIATNP